MYTLYGAAYTRSFLTELVLTELALPYTLETVDILTQDHRTPAYLAINPAGWVPALRTPDGMILHETPAINLHLSEQHGNDILAPARDNPDRGAFLSALFYLTDELEPALKRFFYPHRYVARDGDDHIIAGKALRDVHTCLQVIEERLQVRGPFHLGARYSLADLTLTYWAKSVGELDGATEFPAVNACAEAVSQRPALQDKFAQLNDMMRAYRERTAQGARVD